MRANFTTGALVASLAAGPIVMIPIAVFGATAAEVRDWRFLATMPLFVFLSMLFGFAIAVISNFVGAATLAWAGTRRPGFRHPLVWAVVGAVFGWSLSVVAFRSIDNANLVTGADGLLCALICRRFTGWDD